MFDHSGGAPALSGTSPPLGQPGALPRRPASRAFAWSGLESAARQGLGIALSFSILAFVTPHDLGVYTLAFSFVLTLALVVDDPVSEALIQQGRTGNEDWNTGFTLNLVVAAAVVLLAAVIAGPLAGIYGEPALHRALPVLGSSILVGSLGNIQKAHLTRELRFGTLVRIALVANTAGGAVALGLAAGGFGYWALLSNLVVSNCVSSTLYWRASAWRPRLTVHRASVARIWRFTGQSFAAQCVLQLRESALPVAVGWFGGTTLLGSFGLALRLSRTLGLFFEDVTRRPLFTLLSRMHNARDATGPLLMDVSAAVWAVALPGFFGLALVGPVLTPLVFGARWTDEGHLLPLLCAIVLGWLTLHVPAVGLRARGQPGRAVAVLLGPTLIDMLIITAAMPFGVELALVLMAVRAALWLPVLVFVMRQWLDVPTAALLRRCRLPLLATLAMAAATMALRPRLGDGWAALAGLTGAGAAAYAGTMLAGFGLGDRHLVSALRGMQGR